jgi:hypothetical protein
LCGFQGGRDVACGIGRRAVAQHHVHQQHRGVRLLRCALDLLHAEAGVQHRMRAAHGVLVRAEIQHAMRPAAVPAKIAAHCARAQQRLED